MPGNHPSLKKHHHINHQIVILVICKFFDWNQTMYITRKRAEHPYIQHARGKKQSKEMKNLPDPSGSART